MVIQSVVSAVQTRRPAGSTEKPTIVGVGAMRGLRFPDESFMSQSDYAEFITTGNPQPSSGRRHNIVVEEDGLAVTTHSTVQDLQQFLNRQKTQRECQRRRRESPHGRAVDRQYEANNRNGRRFRKQGVNFTFQSPRDASEVGDLINGNIRSQEVLTSSLRRLFQDQRKAAANDDNNNNIDAVANANNKTRLSSSNNKDEEREAVVDTEKSSNNNNDDERDNNQVIVRRLSSESSSSGSTVSVQEYSVPTKSLKTSLRSSPSKRPAIVKMSLSSSSAVQHGQHGEHRPVVSGSAGGCSPSSALANSRGVTAQLVGKTQTFQRELEENSNELSPQIVLKQAPTVRPPQNISVDTKNTGEAMLTGNKAIKILLSGAVGIPPTSLSYCDLIKLAANKGCIDEQTASKTHKYRMDFQQVLGGDGEFGVCPKSSEYLRGLFDFVEDLSINLQNPVKFVHGGTEVRFRRYYGTALSALMTVVVKEVGSLSHGARKFVRDLHTAVSSVQPLPEPPKEEEKKNGDDESKQE